MPTVTAPGSKRPSLIERTRLRALNEVCQCCAERATAPRSILGRLLLGPRRPETLSPPENSPLETVQLGSRRTFLRFLG